MTIKLGVIGIGEIGQEHIYRCNSILQGAKVVAISDINLSSTSSLLKRLHLSAKVYKDAYQLINVPEIDAILITSSDATHEKLTLACIEAGKPVFCEKPLSINAEGCHRIIDAEMKHGKRLVQVGFMRSYDPGYRELKKMITNGEIGRPLVVHCAHRNPIVDIHYTNEMTITNTLIHELDVLRWLLEENYKTVQVIFPKSTSKSHTHLQDPQIILLKTESGIHIDVEIFVNCNYGYDIQCEVVGEKGIIKLPDPCCIVKRKNAFLGHSLLTSWKDRFISAYDLELQSFINDVKSNTLTGPSAWDGFTASLAADVCLKSQISGNIEKVVIPPCPMFYNNH